MPCNRTLPALAGLCFVAASAYSLAQEAEQPNRPPLPKLVIAETGKPPLDEALADLEKRANSLKQRKLTPVASYRDQKIERQIREELYSRGFYSATITQSEAKQDGETVTRFRIKPGSRYRYAKAKFTVEGEGAEEAATILQQVTKDGDIRLEGRWAKAERALDAQKDLLQALNEDTCFFTLDVGHEAILDQANNTVQVNYRIRAGRPSTLGDITFSGLEDVNKAYVEQLFPAEKGDCFRRDALSEANNTLLASRLFATSIIEYPDAPTVDGQVPITVAINEGYHRTLKAGVQYSTDIGAGVTAGWQHRNLFGGAEALTSDVLVNMMEQRLTTTYDKPFFRQPNQQLHLEAVLGRQDSEAFKTTGIKVLGAVDRTLDSGWVVGLGGAYDWRRITENNDSRTIGLLSSPAYVYRDTRDDALNATKGWTTRLEVAPFIDVLDTTTVFLKSKATGSWFYTPEDIKFEPTLALRGSFGTINGSDTDTIPATERFYAGGGGSVRGYAFQLLSPLDAQNDPLGGRSLLELTTELRFKVTDTVGLVTFVDAGNAYEETYPNPGDMRYGAGFGVRYYTSFGPVRADVAVPLNRRDNVDDPFQLYFSIGQAF